MGEYADIVGGGTPSTDISEYWDGDINWYAPAEITDQIYISSSQRKITEQGFRHSSAKMLPIGTVLFTSRAGIGKTAILSKKGCTNQGFQSIVPYKDKLDSYFIFSRTEEMKRYAETVGAGSTFTEVSGKQMKNMKLMMPSTINEQQIIGNYFRSIDQLITLHQCKYLFSDKIEIFAWEQRKFSDFTYPVREKNREGLPLVPYAITNEHGFILQNQAHDDFGYMKNTDRTAYNIVPPFSFAYNPARINVGSIGYYEGQENIIISSLYEVFQTKEYVDNKFLLHWLKGDVFPKWIEKLQEGSVRQYFYYDKLCECHLMMPKIEEQRKIAIYFDHLDTLITLHQQK